MRRVCSNVRLCQHLGQLGSCNQLRNFTAQLVIDSVKSGLCRACSSTNSDCQRPLELSASKVGARQPICECLHTHAYLWHQLSVLHHAVPPVLVGLH
jgi:hypothetical protein